jgi:lon-related putative ATP-dependent protease
VNVLVDHSEANGLPIVHETNPTYQNLIGRVEHFAHMGTLVTDFLLIKAGALHRANGGYLVLDARKVLMQQFAWDALKRALSNREIRIESIGEMMSMVSTISLAPFPIPLNIKVILTGDRQLYYMLYQLDPEFSELFRVAADIEDRLDRTPENDLFYARFIATLVSKEGLPPFDKTGVARIVEYGSRMAGDAERLSTHFRNIADLLVEAAHWAGRDGREIVTSADVQLAIDEQVRRADRLRDRSHEAIERGTVLVDTDGEQIGQINGLSVLGIANFAFGQPSRITATVRLGEGDLIDIEREADLGGSLHSKGVLILSQFLAARYAADEPLSLHASLAFEQSYGGVDGDSASLAELCALLSALSGVPIKQSYAVTGSVNQRGQVQAIGGVNEKIEGFFDVCLRCDGIDGRAVIIPESNRTHLMLRHDIVDAVRDERFSVFAISSVDEAMELLTGLTAGVRDSAGIFPEGSVNRLVEDRLVRMAHRRRIFSKGGDTEDS